MWRGKRYGDHNPFDLSDEKPMGITVRRVGRVEEPRVPDVQVKNVWKLDPQGPAIRTKERVLVQVRPVDSIDLEGIIGIKLIWVEPLRHVLQCGT